MIKRDKKLSLMFLNVRKIIEQNKMLGTTLKLMLVNENNRWNLSSQMKNAEPRSNLGGACTKF